MNKIINFILITILLTSFVSAWGVTFPQPQNMQLLRNEEARFWVTIDAVQSGHDLKCDITPLTDGSVELIFDQDEEIPVIIPKGTAQALYGTIRALDAAEYNMHTIQFCPNCEEIIAKEEGVTGVQGKYCVPFKIEVAETRTRTNPQDQVPPKPKDYFWYYVGGGILIVIILIILIVYLLNHKKSDNKKVQKSTKGSKTKTKKKRK